jgi:hypothetical protein
MVATSMLVDKWSHLGSWLGSNSFSSSAHSWLILMAVAIDFAAARNTIKMAAIKERPHTHQP